MELGVVVPVPNWPELFPPQQYAEPPGVTPQVCSLPALTVENVWPPTTGTGNGRSVVDPSPIWPAYPEPQQYAAPPNAMPQEWS
jgi:hypothetical protein